MSSLDNYNPEFFKYFRECNLVEYAVNSARVSIAYSSLCVHIYSIVEFQYNIFSILYICSQTCCVMSFRTVISTLLQHFTLITLVYCPLTGTCMCVRVDVKINN